MTKQEISQGLDSFLREEVEQIIDSEGGGIYWLGWEKVLDRTQNYTDEEVAAVFNQTRVQPAQLNTCARGESEVDQSRIPANEKWPEFLRRLAARILQYELMYAGSQIEVDNTEV